MQPKPGHLGPAYGAQFGDASVVAAYEHRPPYPAAAFDLLAALITDTPRAVLDIGCGPGNLTRPLAAQVERIDAVDQSERMIALAQTLPGGDQSTIRWIVGQVESVALDPPYALIVAGDSLHWMDWYAIMPRFAQMLTAHGYLAIAGVGWKPVPWNAGPICARYSTNREYTPYNVIDELTQRGLYDIVGRQTTASVPFVQSVDHYIESFHARNGLSRARMTAVDAAAFDAEIRTIVEPYATHGQIELQVHATIAWGKPGA